MLISNSRIKVYMHIFVFSLHSILSIFCLYNLFCIGFVLKYFFNNYNLKAIIKFAEGIYLT